MKKIIALVLCACMLCAFGACDKETSSNDVKVKDGAVKATITVKDFGEIVLELYPDIAPQSVYNFIYLAKQGFYDGLVFHRIVSDFVIQAGNFDEKYAERPTEFDYTIKGEFHDNGIENTLSHERGVISWARMSVGNAPYDSASTQFFICLSTEVCQQLDGQYAAFGRVVSGMEIVDAIGKVPTGPNDVPNEPVIIESVTIDSTESFPEPDFIR